MNGAWEMVGNGEWRARRAMQMLCLMPADDGDCAYVYDQLGELLRLPPAARAVAIDGFWRQFPEEPGHVDGEPLGVPKVQPI